MTLGHKQGPCFVWKRLNYRWLGNSKISRVWSLVIVENSSNSMAVVFLLHRAGLNSEDEVQCQSTEIYVSTYGLGPGVGGRGTRH